ncbi:MAG: PaaI family thioesterase [Lachnospiraceae bacterium]|nr:PaaI family thioesterase [Lachnospiraceae bacterium]
MKALEDVRKLFENDKFATENGAVIDEIGDFYAKCSLKLTEGHKNAVGSVMGGVSFTLADFAFAVASNWQNPGVVSLSSNITYLGTAKGERLIAEASCVKNGHTTSYYRVDVQDDLGNPVAAVTVTGYRKSVDKKMIY